MAPIRVRSTNADLYLANEISSQTGSRTCKLQSTWGADDILRISTLTDFAGRAVSYHYDASFQLDVVKLVKALAMLAKPEPIGSSAPPGKRRVK